MTLEVVGLSGKAQAGKDFIFENYLRPEGYRRWALADHLKITAVGRRLATYGEVYDTKPPAVRTILQQMGTDEWRVKYGEGVWCDLALAWMTHINRSWGVTKFVVTDVRFANEVEFVRRLGGKVFRLEAPQRVLASTLSAEARAHRSETALDDYDNYDAVIYNDPAYEHTVSYQVLRALAGHPACTSVKSCPEPQSILLPGWAHTLRTV